MSRTYRVITTIFLVLLALSLLAGLTWANTIYTRFHPVQKDFLVPWLSARTFFTNGGNPYSAEAAQPAQFIYYGRLASQGEDPLLLSLPFPVELFYFPFAIISEYHLASGLWMTCLEICLIILAFFSLRLTGWKPARTLFPVILIFAVLWVFGWYALAGNSGIIFVAAAIAGLLLALRDGQDELAGALLIFPLFKPDIGGLLVLFILWWAIYHRRGRILAGFVMFLVFLLVISFFLYPSWFMPFISGLLSHLQHRETLTPGGILASWWPTVGPRIGLVLTGLTGILLFIEWRKVRRKEFRHFFWTASLVIAATPLLGIPTSISDYEVLFIPLVLVLSIMAERWSSPGGWGVAGFVLLGIFFGPWLIAGGLFLSGISTSNWLAIFTFLFPIMLVIGLYWMRWWAISPPRTWRESLP